MKPLRLASAALALLVASSSHAGSVVYSFSGTVTESYGSALPVGSLVTATAVFSDQSDPASSTPTRAFYLPLSGTVNLPAGLGSLKWVASGSVSLQNEGGYHTFGLSLGLESGSAFFVQLQDIDGNVFTSLALPTKPLPLGSFEVKRAEFRSNPDFGNPLCQAGPAPECQAVISVDVLNVVPAIDITAKISSGAQIGAGTIIGADTVIKEGATVGSGSVLGSDVGIAQAVTLDDNAVIGNGSSLAKGVVAGNTLRIGTNVKIEKDVRIGSGVSIGDNSTIRSGTRIGDNTSIGNIGGGAGVFVGKNVVIPSSRAIADQTTIPNGTVVP